jgi:hypothetical protein
MIEFKNLILTEENLQPGTIYLVPSKLLCKDCSTLLNNMFCSKCQKRWQMEDYAKYFGAIKNVVYKIKE